MQWSKKIQRKNSENCPILWLSSVRPTWDMFTIYDKGVISTKKAFERYWDKHGAKSCRTNTQNYWVIRDDVDKSTFYRKRLYKVDTPHLRRHIRISKVHRIVTYLQDKETLELLYVIGICSVAPIRHTTIPKLEFKALVYGVSLRRQILREHDAKNDKT